MYRKNEESIEEFEYKDDAENYNVKKMNIGLNIKKENDSKVILIGVLASIIVIIFMVFMILYR